MFAPTKIWPGLLVAVAVASSPQLSVAPRSSSCAEFAVGPSRARIEQGGAEDSLRLRILPPSGPGFRDDLPSALRPQPGNGSW